VGSWLVSARGNRLPAVEFGRSLRRKSNAQLERIVLANAQNERVLWAVLDALQHRPDARHLETQIRERLIFKKSLPVPVRASAIWTRSAPQSPKRPWYATIACVVLIALLVAGARVTDADAQLLHLVLDGVRTLGTYLAG
jgi:hypothetical protein